MYVRENNSKIMKNTSRSKNKNSENCTRCCMGRGLLWKNRSLNYAVLIIRT